MATMEMALAVLQHAQSFSDVGGWHVVSDCWSAEEILAELQSREQAGARFTLDTAAISHFHAMVSLNATKRRMRH